MPEKISEEQAAAALKEVLEGHLDENEQPQQTSISTAAPAEPPAETPAQPETPVETAAPADEPPQEAGADDVESLRKRLADREEQSAKDKKDYEDRWKAMQDRAAENERILRDRLLRKSAAADRARQVLERSKTQEGVTQEEVDRIIQDIQGTLNPASTHYSPPAAQTEDADMEKVIELNRFLNEKNMTSEQQEEFGRWIQTEGQKVLTPSEQAVGQRSLDGFLRIAHRAWQETLSEKTKATQRAETVNAVKSIQKTQKEAARAASAPATAPRKQPTAGSPKELNLHKLPQKERDEAISALVRASVEQYR